MTYGQSIPPALVAEAHLQGSTKEFLDAVKSFAAANRFSIHLVHEPTARDAYSFDLLRDDIALLGHTRLLSGWDDYDERSYDIGLGPSILSANQPLVGDQLRATVERVARDFQAALGGVATLAIKPSKAD